MFELERDYHISLFVCSLYEGLVHASLKNTSVLDPNTRKVKRNLLLGQNTTCEFRANPSCTHPPPFKNKTKEKQKKTKICVNTVKRLYERKASKRKQELIKKKKSQEEDDDRRRRTILSYVSTKQVKENILR